jgi:polyisoprenoid-binding protein YceI
MKLRQLALAILAIGVWFVPNGAYGQSKAIDRDKSSLKIRVFKSGAFAAFAHDHEIEAPITEGTIDSSDPASVQLHVESGRLRVLDPEIGTDARAEIQHTMQSAKVLDVDRFPDISYQSTTVTGRGEARWEVRGELTLHGKKQPVTVEVLFASGHYRGSVSIKQSDFGMEPIRSRAGRSR